MDGEEKNMDEEEENINEEEENIEEEEEDLPSAISDENKEKRYRLRENAKKRRSASYVFPSWKSGKKTHCICLKKNDGRSYWLCDTCERWYHPSCIGYLEEEVPIVFDCPQCLELARRRNQSKSKSDERETVKAFPVSLYHTQKEAFMKYLDKIMTCSDIGCAKPDHERHHEFMNDPSMVYNRERNTHCFGKNLFNNQEMIKATECLLSELVYKNTPYKNPYSSWYWSIRELPDCKLKSIFKEHKMYANDYVRYIAGKEMVLFIHCYLTGCSYDAANESAKRTEVKISDILRKKMP
ncbi:uncharacterized protein LOC143066473 [Mytilus galloprovincialis]|uniref:uncharacterized protein LOC143066473 n=1 Tax=Mytilus galloprovincialis TaxID=29158 RepID=UPI003F7B43E7